MFSWGGHEYLEIRVLNLIPWAKSTVLCFFVESNILDR